MSVTFDLQKRAEPLRKPMRVGGRFIRLLQSINVRIYFSKKNGNIAKNTYGYKCDDIDILKVKN